MSAQASNAETSSTSTPEPMASQFTESVKEWPAELDVRKRVFLEMYSRTGSVLRASEGVCHRLSHYRWLRESEIYREAFQIAQALFAEKLKEVVIKQATEGIEEPIIYKGKVQVDEKGNVVTRRRFSQSLIKMVIQLMGRAWNDQMARLSAGSNLTRSNTMIQEIREIDRQRSQHTGPAPKKVSPESMGERIKVGKRFGYELKPA